MHQSARRAADADRASASYDVARTAEGWTIFHDGRPEGSLDTKIAAFDSAVAAAVQAIRSGLRVVIRTAADVREDGYDGAAEGIFEDDSEAVSMARYEIARTAEGWSVIHDGRRETVLDSKMAAFDAAVGAAVASMASGLGVLISVAAADAQDSLPQD